MAGHDTNRLARAMKIADWLSAIGATSEFAAGMTRRQREAAAWKSGAAASYSPSPETWELVVHQMRERERLAAMSVDELFSAF
jgi:hypothetical protein